MLGSEVKPLQKQHSFLSLTLSFSRHIWARNLKSSTVRTLKLEEAVIGVEAGHTRYSTDFSPQRTT